MKSNERLVNFALALYQVIVVCAVVNHHNLVADEKHLVWIGVPVFLLGLFTMRRICKNKFALFIFIFSVYLFGNLEIFNYALFGLFVLWFMHMTLKDESEYQSLDSHDVEQYDFQDQFNPYKFNPYERSEDILYKETFSSLESDHIINVYNFD